MIFDLEHSIKSKMFGYVQQSSGAWHNGTAAQNNIVIYCTSGEINMRVSTDEYHLETGSLLFIPSNTFYQPLAGGSCCYYFFNFEAQCLPEDTDLPNYISIFVHPWLVQGHAYTSMDNYASAIKVEQYIENAPYRVMEIFDLADHLCPEKSFCDQLLLDNLLRELFIRLGTERVVSPNCKIAQILDYINANYSEKISLSTISKKFYLSESYIARLFKKELGTKPAEYINKTRIHASKKIIFESDMSIKEISEKVGFSDACYFSKVFKSMTGISPSDFKKQRP